MYNKIIILIILILNLIIIQSKIYIQDLSSNGTRYQIYTTTSSCYFSFHFLCITDGSESCGNQLNISPSSPSILKFSNETAALFSIGFGTDIGKFTFDLYSGAHTLNIECNEIDLDLISFKLKNNTLKYSNLDTTLTTYWVRIYEIQGINLSSLTGSTINILPEAISFPNCAFLYLCGNIIKLQCIANNDLIVSPEDSNLFLTSNINVTIKTSSKNKSFLLDPLISKDNYNQISNFKFYPDLINLSSLSNFKLLGKDETPLISFTINNTISNIFYSFKNNLGSYFYYAIEGNETSTTFLLPINGLDILNSTYELFIQNGDKLKSVLNISNININQYNNYFSPIVPKSIDYKLIYKNYYTINVPLLNIGFKSDILNPLVPVDIVLNNGIIKSMSFPYGYSNGTALNYYYNISQPVLSFSYQNIVSGSLTSRLDSSTFTFEFSNLNTSIIYDKSLSPTISNIQVIHLVSDLYLYRVYAKIPYKYLYIKLISPSLRFVGPEALVNGTLYDGTFEFITSSYLGSPFSLHDSYQNYIQVIDDSYISISPLILFQTPTTILNFDYTLIKNVSFLYNNIDVTNHRCYNILYFNFTDQVPRDYPILMYPNGLEMNQNTLLLSNKLSNSFYSKYNETIKLFQIDFYVEANTPVGEYTFVLYFGAIKSLYSGSLDTKLMIKKSKLDLQGPVFKNIEKLNQEILIDENIQFNQVGWKFTIQDSINGFDWGYIIVRGEMDLSIYNLTFNSSDTLDGGNLFLGDYQVLLNISYPCISQNYIISQVVLYDRVKRISYFSILPEKESSSAVLNPFLYYLNDSNINKIQVKCKVDPIASLDTTPPEIDYVDVSFPLTDMGGSLLPIQVIFRVIDLESGLKKDQNPIFYINNYMNEIIECKSFIINPFETGATFLCSANLPIGYTNGGPITLSVFGLINNNGLFSGYTTNQLIDLGFRAILDTTFEVCQPNVFGTFKYTEFDTELWIFGRCFPEDSQIKLYYSDRNSTIVKPSILYSSAMKLSNLNQTNKPFDIQFLSYDISIGLFTITPIVYDYYLPQPDLSSSFSSSSSSSLPTSTPLITNSPQKCKGTPICGGPSNGKCITNKGCICNSPWVGLDCLSQIIIINQPKANETFPSTNITLQVSNDLSITKITYKSLISLISIREIDILDNIVYNKTFDKWQVRELESDNTTFIYNTTLQVIKNDQKTLTNITVTLKWFINETTVKFANQELLMNPSTMKYTIEINNYPFNSDLNQLQLIMSASIESNTNDDICSVREYGETTSGDDSNYLKIQVDNHSLYGRFIRRGIIDSKITTISNVLLDKDMNSITSTKQLNSFIGIQVPHFKNNIILDPDFSVLIDSNSASSKSNSICLNKSKLTGSKIAGIVIGSVAFVSVIIVAISYHIIKKKKKAQFISNVNQRMKQMNSDKL